MAVMSPAKQVMIHKLYQARTAVARETKKLKPRAQLHGNRTRCITSTYLLIT